MVTSYWSDWLTARRKRLRVILTPELRQEHGGEYGVLVGGRIVAFGSDSLGALRKAEKAGYRMDAVQEVLYIRRLGDDLSPSPL